MSKVYFTSDWHLGHKNILKYRNNFKSIEEHNNLFFNNYRKIVKKNDRVFFLGDVSFNKEDLFKIKELIGYKILYLGNHDILGIHNYLEVFDEIHSFRSYKNFWLSHCPIHPNELRNRIGNIHGHLHKAVLETEDSKKYFDVSPEKHNFELVDFEEIKKYFN